MPEELVASTPVQNTDSKKSIGSSFMIFRRQSHKPTSIDVTRNLGSWNSVQSENDVGLPYLENQIGSNHTDNTFSFSTCNRPKVVIFSILAGVFSFIDMTSQSDLQPVDKDDVGISDLKCWSYINLFSFAKTNTTFPINNTSQISNFYSIHPLIVARAVNKGKKIIKKNKGTISGVHK